MAMICHQMIPAEDCERLCLHMCVSPMRAVIPHTHRSLVYLGTCDLSQHHAESVTLYQA